MAKEQYVATDLAKSRPMVVPIFSAEAGRNGRKKVLKLVGVGGTVKRKAKPPVRGELTIKEATATEYKALFERGLTRYVEKKVVSTSVSKT